MHYVDHWSYHNIFDIFTCEDIRHLSMQPGGNGGQEEPPGRTSTVQFLYFYFHDAVGLLEPLPCYSLFCGQIDSS